MPHPVPGLKPENEKNRVKNAVFRGFGCAEKFRASGRGVLENQRLRRTPITPTATPHRASAPGVGIALARTMKAPGSTTNCVLLLRVKKGAEARSLIVSAIYGA